ncbi:hypothetical protein [Burkholderia sp. MSMB1589WGS]|uniref:hypothetical protein n=1 Tax=Burkholderia sp. MSMB1589WGS TaxID=1636425 RepID=UPI0007B7A624|nr:hypothetical protein [Burkholderia sp. MSMB1589WGS]
MLTISIYDGEYDGDVNALTHLCDIEGSAVPDDRPPFSVLGETLRVLELCEERYSTPPLSGTSFTAFIGRKDGRDVTPLVRLDGYVRDGCASATVVGPGSRWDTEPVYCTPGDDAVAIVRKLLEPSR